MQKAHDEIYLDKYNVLFIIKGKMKMCMFYVPTSNCHLNLLID